MNTRTGRRFVVRLPPFEQEERARLSDLLPRNGFDLADADTIVLFSLQGNRAAARSPVVSYGTLYEAVSAGCSGELIWQTVESGNLWHLFALSMMSLEIED